MAEATYKKKEHSNDKQVEQINVAPHSLEAEQAVLGGIMLGLGRALGETMAVTFVIGNAYQLSDFSLFAPGNSITSTLANEFGEADGGLHTAALMQLGLLLFVITFSVLAISRIFVRQLDKKRGLNHE